MRKLIVFNMLTLDGYFSGPDGELDWHNADSEFDRFSIEQLNTAGTILFGRKTYDLMAVFWPSPQAIKADPIVAKLMNTLPKIVFSKTLNKAVWNNTTVNKKDIPATVMDLKKKSGKDIFIFGSGKLIQSLANLGLIDEYRLMINPVILSRGMSLFGGIQNRINLKLLRNTIFNSGNVLLYYKPINNEGGK